MRRSTNNSLWRQSSDFACQSLPLFDLFYCRRPRIARNINSLYTFPCCCLVRFKIVLKDNILIFQHPKIMNGICADNACSGPCWQQLVAFGKYWIIFLDFFIKNWHIHVNISTNRKVDTLKKWESSVQFYSFS